MNLQVETLLKKVNLWNCGSKLVKQYSGGMKRRLSVAISLIGSPPIIYLDEPSTGLDPKSRRDLWKVINEAKSHSTVLLTTHSMEEADTLCDRLMIMGDGQIKAVGVGSYLKLHLGEGYKLAIQTSKGTELNQLEKFVEKLLPGSVMLNHVGGTTNFHVPKSVVSLSKVFTEMEQAKKQMNITTWAIVNTTLEEVFLKVCSQK